MWNLRSGLRRRNHVTHSFPSGNNPSSVTRCSRNTWANSHRYTWQIGCPRAVVRLIKDTRADSSVGVKAWFWMLTSHCVIPSLQMMKKHWTRRSSCIGSLIGVLISPIRKPGNGVGDVLSDLGASRPFGLGHVDSEDWDIPLGHATDYLKMK